MNKFEQQPHNFELLPEIKVRVVASLEGRHFLKTDQGQYLLLSPDLEQYEEVPEEAVASAILKHGYQPVAGSQVFEFGQRKEILKGNL